MGSLTPADVKRWDLNAIHAVFQTATGRANTLQRLGDSLQQAHDVLAEWQGEAGDAFRVDIGKIRRDIEADGAESKQVAAAVSSAEADVSACRRELDDIEQAARANGWSITPDWRIDVGERESPPIESTWPTSCRFCRASSTPARGMPTPPITSLPPRSALPSARCRWMPPDPRQVPQRRKARRTLRRGASRRRGKTCAAYRRRGRSPGGTPPKSPPAPTAAGPGGVPRPPAGVGGKPRSLEEMLLPAGAVPLPQPSPAEMENAKALLRKVMIGDGVPPDQIEARVNEAVAGAQRWIDQGGIPPYIPPEPKPLPPPGFGEGFGDRWRATEESIHNLLGVGPRGASGALQSWEQMLEGTVETTQNPLGAAVGEVQNAVNSPSPAYYLGGKASDAAFALPAMLFGPEAAGVGKIADFDAAAAIDYGPTHLPHAPVGFDNPVNYHSFADQAGQDLYSAFMHGEPTPGLSQQLADMSTHHVGDNLDRVVLGKFGGQEGGYIGEARGHGGIYFDTGDPTWDAMTYGLNDGDRTSLVWQVNEQFLRGQMARGVPRIDYELLGKFGSVDDVLDVDPDSFSAMEIAFLKGNAEAYGYRQVGNSWVRVTDGR